MKFYNWRVTLAWRWAVPAFQYLQINWYLQVVSQLTLVQTTSIAFEISSYSSDKRQCGWMLQKYSFAMQEQCTILQSTRLQITNTRLNSAWTVQSAHLQNISLTCNQLRWPSRSGKIQVNRVFIGKNEGYCELEEDPSRFLFTSGLVEDLLSSFTLWESSREGSNVRASKSRMLFSRARLFACWFQRQIEVRGLAYNITNVTYKVHLYGALTWGDYNHLSLPGFFQTVGSAPDTLQLPSL